MEDIKYPTVDLSTSKPNLVKRDPDDQIDISFTEGAFSDGRPFLVEFWVANQVSYLTYYFPTIDIENLSAFDLKEYLKSEHVIEFFDEKFISCGFSGTNVDANKRLYDSGNEIWVITIIVGDEDETYVRHKIPMQKYQK